MARPNKAKTRKDIMQKRPSGVTLLSATAVVAAILMILNGSLLASFAPFKMMPQYGIMGMQLTMPWLLGATAIYGLGMIMFVMGIASFFTAYGLLRGDAWARTSMIVFTGVGLGIFVLAMALFNITEIANVIINGSILAYLFKPNVREYFRGVQSQGTKTAPQG